MSTFGGPMTPVTPTMRLTLPSRFYTPSCLPHTMSLADEHHAWLEDCELPESNWSFEDRILVWLDPDLERAVRTYYTNKGPSLASLHNPRYLKVLDGTLRTRLLRRLRRLEAESIEAAVLESMDAASRQVLVQLGPLVGFSGLGAILDRATSNPTGRYGKPPAAEDDDAHRKEAQALYEVAMGPLSAIPAPDRSGARLGFLKLAAVLGNVEAMFALGFLLASDAAILNLTLAARLFRGAANKDHRGALFNLGAMTYEGKGVSSDHRTSIDCFMRADRTGHAKAAAMLAVMHIRGQATEQKLMKAKQYLERARELAQHDLADLAELCDVARSAVMTAMGIRAAAGRGDLVAT